MSRKDVSFTVPGDPAVKGRPRFTRYGRAYTPKKTADAEKVIAEAATLAFDGFPFTEPVGIELTFFCATKRRSDGDNLVKLVLDAMNTIAYTDDYLVEEWRVRVYRKREGEAPRTEVLVYALDDGL